MLKKLFRKLFMWAMEKDESEKPVQTPPKVPTLQELDNRDEQIRNLTKKDKEINLVTCPNCYLKTPSNRIVKCAECGHVGCKECFTYDPSNKAYYCDNCW